MEPRVSTLESPQGTCMQEARSMRTVIEATSRSHSWEDINRGSTMDCLAGTKPGWLAVLWIACPDRLVRELKSEEVLWRYLTAKLSGISHPCGESKMSCIGDKKVGVAWTWTWAQVWQICGEFWTVFGATSEPRTINYLTSDYPFQQYVKMLYLIDI